MVFQQMIHEESGGAAFKRSGKGTPAKLTCSSADPKKVADYAKEISENKDREKYN